MPRDIVPLRATVNRGHRMLGCLRGCPARRGSRLRGLLILAAEIEDGVLLVDLVVAFATHKPTPRAPRLEGRPEGSSHAGITTRLAASSGGPHYRRLGSQPRIKQRRACSSPAEAKKTGRGEKAWAEFGFAALARRRCLDRHRLRCLGVPSGGLERHGPARQLLASRFPRLASHCLCLPHASSPL